MSEHKPDALAVSQDMSRDICRVTTPESREARGRAFAADFANTVTKGATKFLRERESELRQIRQDFDDKPKLELICGVRTFTEYCENVMGYGVRQAQRILEGRNPSLTDQENKLALDRKAKRELTVKANRALKALPIRTKTNAEILADTKESTETSAPQQKVSPQQHLAMAEPFKAAIEAAPTTTTILTARLEKIFGTGQVKAEPSVLTRLGHTAVCPQHKYGRIKITILTNARELETLIDAVTAYIDAGVVKDGGLADSFRVLDGAPTPVSPELPRPEPALDVPEHVSPQASHELTSMRRNKHVWTCPACGFTVVADFKKYPHTDGMALRMGCSGDSFSWSTSFLAETVVQLQYRGKPAYEMNLQEPCVQANLAASEPARCESTRRKS